MTLVRFRRACWAFAALIACSAAGCTGSINGQPGEDPPSAPTPPGADRPGPVTPTPTAPVPQVSTARLLRLSHAQWENAVRDLLRLPKASGLSARFTKDAVIGKFDNGENLQVDELLRRDYREAAEALAQQVIRDPMALQRLTAGMTGDAAAFLRAFGRRAFRRPLTDAEVGRYQRLFASGRELYGGADPFTDGVRATVEAMLQSAHFLYRTELAGGREPTRALDPYERAAKLAFTLTNSIPDDALLASAADGTLMTAAGVRAAAERLLGTPGAVEMLDGFHRQLLRLDGYDQIEKDRTLFPEYAPDVGAEMRQEAQLFVRDVMSRRGGLRDLLLSSHTFVNARLASIYKVAGAPADGSFGRVELDQGQRAGLLTQLGFLAANAHAKEVDSIHRGVFVHTSILCTELPAPAEGVSLSGAKGRTNRERITSITGEGTCGAGCHSHLINPVGFAFEQYDALGRHRTTDGGFPADASGRYAFDGTERSWTNAIEFVRLVADSRVAHECYARALFERVHARPPAPAEMARVAALGQRSLAMRASVRDLLLDLVTGDDFLNRLR